MTKREERVINAFINCVKCEEFSFDYACILMEDTTKYGYLTDEAKETFYSAFTVVDEKIEEENIHIEEELPDDVEFPVEDNVNEPTVDETIEEQVVEEEPTVEE